MSSPRRVGVAVWHHLCKIAGVTPLATLTSIKDKHRDALALVHAGLDESVQETFARWEDRIPNPQDVHGAVLAADVRQTLKLLCAERLKQQSLGVAQGPNMSVVLFDNLGLQLRVRRHPKSLKTGQLLAPTSAPTATLFGEDDASLLWQPYVLWTPDLRTKALRGAWLAAVADIDEEGKAVIYERVPLPAAEFVAAGSTSPVSAGDDDSFGDFFADDADSSSSPA